VLRNALLSDSEIEAVLNARQTDDVKHLLRRTTQEAIEIGAFGAPTMVVRDLRQPDEIKSLTQGQVRLGNIPAEAAPDMQDGDRARPRMFFGSDRFELLAACYGLRWLGPDPEQTSTHPPVRSAL